MSIFLNNKKKISLSVAFILLLLVPVLCRNYLNLESILQYKTAIALFVEHHYLLSVMLFFLACLIFINSPIPLAAIIKFLGGYFFGFYLGALFNIIATILACLAGFSVSRYLFKQAFERKYYQRLKKVETSIEKNGFYYFLSLRLIMIVPYFIINILAGISPVSFRKYFYSTTLGVFPASIVYANGGSKLEQISTINDLFRLDLLLALILIISLLLVPKLVSCLQRKKSFKQ